MIAIALVDDHKVVTRSLKAYLESFADLHVCGIATSGEELLQHMIAWRPNIVIVDLLMPSGWDGIETTRRVKAQMPTAKVIALTASTDEPRMRAVFRAGASGYVRKDADPETLLAAVRAVSLGRTYIDPSVAITVAAPDEELSPRELEVLRLLGKSNKEIAARLHVGEETVKTHVTSILRRLGVDNRANALSQALKRGLLSLDEVE